MGSESNFVSKKSTHDMVKRVNEILTEEDTILTISRVYKNILAKGFSLSDAKLGARKKAILICQTSHGGCNASCRRCEDCISDAHIRFIIS